MSDERDALAMRTATTRRKTWWPGWIWAIPLAAIGIVVWLLLRALSSRGIDVTLLLENSTGMSDNNTKVLYRGLEVGTVSSLALAPDARHIVAHLDIDRDMSPYIRSGTRFYVEGAHPSLADPASLEAMISGPTIELVPGPGAPTQSFAAIEGGDLQAFSRKLGRIPIDQIGDNVRALTARLKALTASPQLDDSIRHLDSTLANLDETVRAAGPQVAPTLRDVRRTVASLRSTAANIDTTAAAARGMMSASAAAPGGNLPKSLRELTDAARSIRALADYLDQHPEALIRGR